MVLIDWLDRNHVPLSREAGLHKNLFYDFPRNLRYPYIIVAFAIEFGQDEMEINPDKG